ncbi:lamin tail domain-containing protein [bacterium]|nr:lamin tail domain-containing protein [bacterium]
MRSFTDLLYNTDQGYQLIDDYASIINDPAGGPSMVDADRAMWDYHPIMTSSYVYSSKAGEGRFYGKSATGDFEGMAQLMKNYIVSRGTWIGNNILTDHDMPDTPTIAYTGVPDYAANGLMFQTSAFSSSVSAFAAMEWRLGEITDTLSPDYDPSDEPVYEITAVWESGELDVYAPGVAIPSTAVEAGRTYRARVRMKDADGRWSHWSDPVEFTAGEIESDQRSSIRITEIMYHPREPLSGPYVDNDYEFLEIRNTGPDPVNLAGMSFTNGLTFEFPDYTLPAGAYAVAVRNLAAFQARYNTSGMHILGTYAGGLDNAGERLRLVGSWGEEIHDFSYNDSWYKITDGDGFSLTIADETGSDWDSKDGWRPSWLTDGSPGQGDPGLAPGSIRISELLAHTDGPDGDWIELLNTTAQDINLGGWCLSDDADALTKYVIPADTILPANGLIVFTQTGDFGGAFGFSELGDEAWLTAVDGGQITGFRVSEDFDASEREVTFGRYTTSTGNVDFVAMSGETPALPNAYPLVGPVVINEIMYNPAAGGDEFIELLNPTAAAVDLFDPANPGNTWSLEGGVDYVFPTGVALPAGGYALVVGIEPATFRAAYSVPAAVPIFGPWAGALDNGGESVRLYKPGDPEPGGFVPSILVERVKYDDALPWPGRTDGEGSSLSRAVPLDYGNDSANWRSSTTGGTPGALNVLIDSTPPGTPDGLAADPATHEQIDLVWNAATDGQSGVDHYVIYRDGVAIGASPTPDYADGGLLEAMTYTYRVSAVNGDGFESGQSPAIQASPRPSLQGVQTLDATHVRVVFGKDLDRTAAETVANYSIDDGGVPLVISDVSLDAGDRSVTLTLAAPMVEDTTYTLAVEDVTDTAGTPILPGTTLDFTYAAWVHEDIGNVAAAGDMTYVNGTFTIQGSGADIWGGGDEFHFVHRSWYGDVEITARVVSLTNTNGWAKAGVMIRDTLANNSAHAMTVFTPGNGVSFQRRPYAGGGSAHNTVGTSNHWVRLVRIGDMLTSYRSPDGTDWTYINSVSVPMTAEVEIGLAVTSHNDGAIATAVIDNVEVRAIDAPVVSIDDVSVAEGDSGTVEAAFTVTLSRAASMPVSVAYATADGAATTGEGDYDALSGSLTFNPGESLTKTVRVTVHSDVEFESLETFALELSDPRNCVLDSTQGTASILDDEVDVPTALAIATEVFDGGQLAVDGPGTHSLGILDLDVNGNIATTLYALRSGSGWLHRVQGLGGRWDAFAGGAERVWHTAQEWADIRVRGLDADTAYTFHATARNDSGVESAEIEVGTYSTGVAGDLNDSGRSSGIDFALVRRGVQQIGVLGIDVPWCIDVNDDGTADDDDILAEREHIVNP